MGGLSREPLGYAVAVPSCAQRREEGLEAHPTTLQPANVKATQGLAKDAFDAINNRVAFSP